jgi:hypothetical protein
MTAAQQAKGTLKVDDADFGALMQLVLTHATKQKSGLKSKLLVL